MIYEDYSIFTVGPVKMSDDILEIGGKQTPYFRNDKFSQVLLRCEELLLQMANAPQNSRVVFLTASGTAGMESAVMNLLGKDDDAIVVNGGTFGQRFVDLCTSHDVPHFNFKVENTNLSDINDRVENVEKYNALLVNAHETSVGTLYDLNAIGQFCKDHNLFHIVDAISMFATDELDMQKHNIDAVITSSHKGLGLPPGLSMIILSPKAIERLNDVKVHYFNFKNYLKNGERGQTPYTPAVSIALQLLHRLETIEKSGGVASSIQNAKEVSEYFRGKIKELNLPFDFYSDYLPNAMTILSPTNGENAKDIVKILEEEYKVIVNPNGGELGDKIFRVSHMGAVTKEYMDILLSALKKIN